MCVCVCVCVYIERERERAQKGVAAHSSILAWRIPWTEEPGRLQSTSLQDHKELDTTE